MSKRPLVPRSRLPFVPGVAARPLGATLPTAAVLMSDVPGAMTDAADALTGLGAALQHFAGTEAPPVPDAAEIGRERARVEVGEAVRVYTRVLRGVGVSLPTTLVAVAAAVRTDAALRLSADAWSAIQHDAARCCLEAYYGP